MIAPAVAYLTIGTIAEANFERNVGAPDAATALALLVGLSFLACLLARTRREFLVVLIAMLAAVGLVAARTGVAEGMRNDALAISIVSPVLLVGLSSWFIRKLRDDLSSTADHLSELVDSRDRLVAAVSHELRTPLTGIVGLSEELAVRRTHYTEVEIDEFTAIIAEQGRDMADIIDDLLVASRVDADALIVQLGPVDLRGEIDRVLKTPKLTELVGDGSIKVVGAGVVAKADALRCRQIIRNLISNALRYGGDEIDVTVDTEGDRAIVLVSDNGMGLSEAEVEQLFEPYHTANRNSNPSDSVGLGLSVSRRLARIMDGDLTCSITPAAAVFRLELDVVPSPAGDPPA